MSVDIIGALYDPGQDGEPVRLWGFHVNVTPDLTAAHPELEAKVIVPDRFRRVWAGEDPAAPVSTVALRFNGETAAREALGDLWPA